MGHQLLEEAQMVPGEDCSWTEMGCEGHHHSRKTEAAQCSQSLYSLDPGSVSEVDYTRHVVEPRSAEEGLVGIRFPLLCYCQLKKIITLRLSMINMFLTM